jgi:hypothetical protein
VSEHRHVLACVLTPAYECGKRRRQLSSSCCIHGAPSSIQRLGKTPGSGSRQPDCSQLVSIQANALRMLYGKGMGCLGWCVWVGVMVM